MGRHEAGTRHISFCKKTVRVWVRRLDGGDYCPCHVLGTFTSRYNCIAGKRADLQYLHDGLERLP